MRFIERVVDSVNAMAFTGREAREITIHTRSGELGFVAGVNIFRGTIKVMVDGNKNEIKEYKGRDIGDLDTPF